MIVRGHPACPVVLKTFHAFFASAKTDGKATVSGWRCAYQPPAVMKTTRLIATCAKNSEVIAARK